MAGYTGISNRVSVVTPVYNGEGHLHRLLESVLAQTYDQIEMILVDDGSQDNTLVVAEAFREKFRERGFRFQTVPAEHRNASAAINRGLPLVTGEFLVWPDSDDALHPQSIQKRVEFLRANPQYQAVRSLGCHRYEDGSPAPAQEKMGCREEELFFPILMGESFVCCGCYMLRCGAFFDLYPQRKIPEYSVGQNFQMLLPLLYFHRCATLREELYTVYVRPDSHSHRALTQREEEQKYAGFEALVDEITGICRIGDPKELGQIQLWKQRRRYGLFMRHNKRLKAAQALLWLYTHGDMGLGRAAREAAKLICGPRIREMWQRRRR